MGIGAIGSALGGVGSLVSGIGGLTSGSGGAGSPGSVPMGYPMQNPSQADTNYQYLTWQTPGSMQNLSVQGYGNVYNLTQNPSGLQSYVPGYQAGANTSGAYGTNTLAPMEANAAQSLYGAGGNVLNTAFDPQLALYNKTAQQTQDQANAINAMYGLSSSPYGAGVANQAMTNFNIDWQNQQLQRQAQGIQSSGLAYGGVGDLGQSAMQTYLQAGATPYQAYQQQQNDQLQALSTGQGLDANTLNALAAYLRLGQSATAVGQSGAQTAGQLQNQQFNQAGQIGQNIGQGLSGLSNLSTLFGPGSNSYSGPNSIYDPNAMSLDQLYALNQ